MKLKTLVIGKNGQLASEIRDLVRRDASFTFVGRDEIDPRQPGLLIGVLDRVQPDIVINCAAYVQFDKAEANPEACRLLNVDFVRSLARESARRGFHLVHFSTDYVFDGHGSKPYREMDECRPLSVYGKSKREGELAIIEEAKSAVIVRTSWLYSKSGDNFLKTMLRLADGPQPLRVVNDQHGTPTWARDLARATNDFFAKPTGKIDLYHFAGTGEATWYELASEIMQVWGKSKEVLPIPTSAFPSVGQRPKYSALTSEKFTSASGIEVAPWRESLKECFRNWETK